MTTYYVDPINGNNANTGLSWGAAWLWITGSGTSILPGDEVRFAETVKKTTTHTYLPGKSSIAAAASPPLASWALPTAWTKGSGMPAGITSAFGGFTTASGTVIPAASKIAYAAVGSSPDTTVFSRMQVTLAVMNLLPVGTEGSHLVLKLCSDTTGDVPVATLTFKSHTPPGAALAYVRAYVDTGSATPLNLGTIGSVAFYSVAGWTAAGTTSNTSIIYSYAYLTPTFSSTEYVEPKSAYWVGPINTADFAPIVKVFGCIATYNGSGPYVEQQAAGLGAIAYSAPYTQGSYQPLDTYPPLPIDEYERDSFPQLSFAGTSGQRITLSGGWNTSTGLQTGYTCLNSRAVGPASPGLMFTAASDYLTVSRFLCTDSAILNFRQTSDLTFQSLIFDDCVGMGMYSLEQPTYTNTIASLVCTRCACVSMDGAISITASNQLSQRTAVSYITSVSWVDSIVSKNDYSGGQKIALVALWELVSSVMDTITCMLSAQTTTTSYGQLNLSNGSTGTLRMVGCAIGAYLSTITGHTTNTSTSSPDLFLDNMTFTSTAAAGQRVTISAFANTYIGKFTLRSTGAYEDFITVDNWLSLAWNSLIQPSCTLGGPFVLTEANTVPHLFKIVGCHELTVLPMTNTAVAGGCYPNLYAYQIGEASIGASSWTHMVLGTSDNAQFHTPGVSGGPMTLTGVNALIEAACTAGSVIMIGCTLRGAETDTGSLWYGSRIAGSSQINGGKSSICGVLAYGCTFDATMGSSIPMLGSNSNFASSSNYTRMFQIHGEAYVTSTTATAGSNAYFQYADDYAGAKGIFTTNTGYTQIQVDYSDTESVYLSGGAKGRYSTTGAISSAGTPAILIEGNVPFGTIYGMPGQVVTIAITATSESYGDSLTLFIPPCAHYLVDLSGHAMCRPLVYAVEAQLTYTIYPQQEGVLDLYLYGKYVTISSYSISQ